jgi:hypothetical protein
MMEDIQPVTDTTSAAPESSAPVADARPSVAPATTDTSSQAARTSRGRSSKKAPQSTAEKFHDTMSAVYDRASKGEAAPAVSADVPGPSLEEVYSKRDAALDGLAATFDGLPPEARDYLRTAIDRLPMPQAWGQEKAEAWNKLDPSTQAYISEREQSAHQRITELGQEVSHMRQSGGMVGELADVVAHFTPRLPPEVANMSRPEQIARLYAASEAIHRDPVGSIIQLARHHGVDLSQIGGNPQAAAQQQQIVSQYAQRVQYLEQQNAQLQAQQREWHQTRQQYFQREMEGFIKERADYWSPELEDEVLRQVNAVRDTNPSVFNMDPLTVVRQAEARAKKIVGIQAKQDAVEAKKKADDAKRLGSMNVKSKIGRSPSGVSENMWSADAWDSAYDKAAGGR